MLSSFIAAAACLVASAVAQTPPGYTLAHSNSTLYLKYWGFPIFPAGSILPYAGAHRLTSHRLVRYWPFAQSLRTNLSYTRHLPWTAPTSSFSSMPITTTRRLSPPSSSGSLLAWPSVKSPLPSLARMGLYTARWPAIPHMCPISSRPSRDTRILHWSTTALPTSSSPPISLTTPPSARASTSRERARTSRARCWRRRISPSQVMCRRALPPLAERRTQRAQGLMGAGMDLRRV